MDTRETWMVTCDSAEAGHGTDHGSLEAARECTWNEHLREVGLPATSAVSIIYEDEVEPQVWLFESRDAAERFASGVQIIGSAMRGTEGYNFLVDVHSPEQVLDGSQVAEALGIFLTNLEED